MTTIRFYRSQDRFSGFSCQGHSGYADAGEDIVCAAITSAIRLAECTINDVLNAQAQVHVKEKTAEISLQLPAGNPGGDAVMQGLFLYLTELSKENPHHLSVLEV
jgi:uncharacterized protein YsxB (DUF464 family)